MSLSRDSLDLAANAPYIDSLEFELGKVKVEVTNSDVEDIEADVVLISNNGSLYDGAAAAESLLRAGGESYRNSLKALKKDLGKSDTKVLRCDAGSQLKCKKVYHAVFDKPYSGRKPEDWQRFLEGLYSSAFSMALQDRATTLAVVLLGAGKAGGPTRDSVRAALEAFSRLPDPGCLSRLLLVERDERRTREAKDECEKWRSERPVPPQ